MYLFRTALIQKLRGFTKLRAADNRVIDQKKTFIFNQFLYRKHLHLGNQIPLTLNRRHKGTRPGRRILNEWSGKWHTRLVCITHCVRRAGIRNTGNNIRLHIVPLRHLGSAVVAHLLHADPFVGAGRIAVIDPEESTDFHLLSRLHQRHTVGIRQHHNLARA